jgi:hypothetical protein
MARESGRLRLQAKRANQATSDGRRYLAYQLSRTVHVVDTAGSGSRVVTAPAGCQIFRDFPTRVISYPTVLLGCRGGQILLDAITGKFILLPKGVFWNEVGRVWVQGNPDTCPDGVSTCDGFYDRRTSAVHSERSRLSFPPERDLDSPGLSSTEPCAPAEWRIRFSPPFTIANYDGRNEGLYLGRCGSARLRRLDIQQAGSFALSGGLVSWARSRGRVLRAYDAIGRRSYRWVVPDLHVECSSMHVLQTRTRVYAAATLKALAHDCRFPTLVRLYVATIRR